MNSFQVVCLLTAVMLLFGLKNDFIPDDVSSYRNVIVRSQGGVRIHYNVIVQS